MRLFAGAVALSIVMAGAASAQDRETALRCGDHGDALVYARHAMPPIAVQAGLATVSHSGGRPPQVMVDGWHPAPAPLGDVLSALGREAGFAVVGADGLPRVSWNGRAAPLSVVLDDLVGQAGASWSYASGVVTVSRTPQASSVSASIVQPEDRDETLALLDTLRGYDATDVTLGAGTIGFRASSAALPRLSSGVASIAEIDAFDVSFLRGRPGAGRYPWSSLSPTFAASGAGGSAVVASDADVAGFLRANGDVESGGDQTVAGPAGWALVVPQSQCGRGSNELTLKARRAGDGFSLQVSGLGTPVAVPMVALGRMVVLARPDPIGGWIDVVTIRPRVLAIR